MRADGPVELCELLSEEVAVSSSWRLSLAHCPPLDVLRMRSHDCHHSNDHHNTKVTCININVDKSNKSQYSNFLIFAVLVL